MPRAPGLHSEPPPPFPAIDLLRGVAASSVLLFHVIVLSEWDSFPHHGVLGLFRNGWVGVDLFLVISGFVIALTALKGYQREGLGFRAAFARHRLARIVPLYLLTGLAYLFIAKPALLAEPAPLLWARIASFVLFLQNLQHTWHGAINGPSWSVALEMQFYVVVLFCAPYLARARVMPTLVAAVLIGSGYRLVTTLALEPGASSIQQQFVYLTQLPGVIDLFMLGMALALVVHRSEEPAARWLQAGWRPCALWSACAAALLTLAHLLFERYGYWNNRAMLVAWRPLLGLGLCALVAAAITWPLPHARWLAPLRYLGTISYGIYLWHFPVLIALTNSAPPWSGPTLLAWVSVGTLLLASLSWHWLERPNIRRAQSIGTPQGLRAGFEDVPRNA